MKRAFSMTELQAAIAAGSVRPQEEEIKSSTFKGEIMLLRRSKSMGNLSLPPQSFPAATLPDLEDRLEGSSPTEATQMFLPSLSSLGLSIPGDHTMSHGYEELKRSRGSCGTNQSFCSSPPGHQNISRQSNSGQDEETRGAAAALMDLFRQQPTTPVGSSTNFVSYPSQNKALPSLQDLMSNSNVDFGTSASSTGQGFTHAL